MVPIGGAIEQDKYNSVTIAAFFDFSFKIFSGLYMVHAVRRFIEIKTSTGSFI
jgi:hypothetical protein